MEFKNTEVYGFNAALRGMRNPMNSWEKSDSVSKCNGDCDYCNYQKCLLVEQIIIGENDLKLAQSLLKAGNEHSKFMRMIHVSVDVDMPRYWWAEADCYKFGSKNSCSTMHKLLNNNNSITLDMFVYCEEDLDLVIAIINRLEELRKEYKEIQNTTKNIEKMDRLLLRAKRLLLEGFLQLRTWDTNYAELRNMYFQRRYHKLKEEWVDTFCKWVESLPYSKELIMYEGE